MNDSLYIAIDLGAGSGRVFLAGVAPGEFLLEEVRRFHYPAQLKDGHLRWDFAKIFTEIKTGVREAGERARQLGRRVQSIGVDSWAVDYGLIDSEGQLTEDPICYRDARTEGVMEKVFQRVPREEIFARTGIQFLVLNTLFQFYAHTHEGLPVKAAQLLLIPDLINYFLTGRRATEYTNATTTQMVNAQTGTWDGDLLKRLGLSTDLFTEILPAGTNLGYLRQTLTDELGLQKVHVVAPATHDTASAVIGAPLESGWAYISSGTWSLVGVERHSVLINEPVARHNFTNEGGAFGTIRFLKNVMGLWILEACRKEWQAEGIDVDYENLLAEAEALDGFDGLIFPDDPCFFNPPSMLKAIADQLRETGQPGATSPAKITKVILDSLAFRYAAVLSTIESLTQQQIKGVHIVGGGSRNDYLSQMTATITRKPVLAGPAEATVSGNVLVQAIVAGRFASLAQARQHIAANVQLKQFTPRPSSAGDEALNRYARIERRYAD
jgi:rhamnulokinase